MSRNILARIQAANRGRDSLRMPLKYAAISESPFRFFRGTCHLFYEDWPRKSILNKAPAAWITGDLHLENFGSFKGDDGQVYFDLNDFDEAALAPCTWEMARTVTSIFLAAAELNLEKRQARALAARFLEDYCQSLENGKASWIVQSTATGPISSLLTAVCERSRLTLLNHRSREVDGVRHLIVDDKHLLKASPSEREKVEKMMRKFAKRQPDPTWFEPLDIAVRIAGTGSLGLLRYVVLVRGNGSPDKNQFIDLKETRGSSLEPFLKLRQPDWPEPAQRVIEVQKRMQAVCPRHLAAVRSGRRSFLLKVLQPQEDRLDLALMQKPGEIEAALTGMARVAAWAQLRSGGRQGSANADQLIRFGSQRGWVGPLLKYAENYARTVKSDWKEFRSRAA